MSCATVALIVALNLTGLPRRDETVFSRSLPDGNVIPIHLLMAPSNIRQGKFFASNPGEILTRGSSKQ